jgi:hypothetical protein
MQNVKINKDNLFELIVIGPLDFLSDTISVLSKIPDILILDPLMEELTPSERASKLCEIAKRYRDRKRKRSAKAKAAKGALGIEVQ